MIGFETDDAACSPTQAFDVDATHVFSAEEAVRMNSWMYLSSAGPQNDVEKDVLILLSDLSIVEYDQAVIEWTKAAKTLWEGIPAASTTECNVAGASARLHQLVNIILKELDILQSAGEAWRKGQEYVIAVAVADIQEEDWLRLPR